MASKISSQQVGQTMEEIALKNVKNWEKAGPVGFFENKSQEFIKLRESSINIHTTSTQSDDRLIDTKKPEGKAKNKFWQRDQVQWNTTFRSIDNDLEDLATFYSEKRVTHFNNAKERETSRKIKQIMKRVQGKFRSMKIIVDKLNVALYSKDKKLQNKDKDGNLLFEDDEEWRVAERVTVDLTARLQKKQQELNVIMVKDTMINKYVEESAIASGGKESKQLEAMARMFQENKSRLEAEGQEVQEIVKAVQDICKMVTDMSLMIHEQGTIVDRIDYNLEVASVRTLKGKEFFQKAEKKNKQAGSMAIYCIAAMVVVNSVLGIAVLVKVHGST